MNNPIKLIVSMNNVYKTSIPVINALLVSVFVQMLDVDLTMTASSE